MDRQCFQLCDSSFRHQFLPSHASGVITSLAGTVDVAATCFQASRAMSSVSKHWCFGWHLFTVFKNSVCAGTDDVTGTCFQSSRILSSPYRHCWFVWLSPVFSLQEQCIVFLSTDTLVGPCSESWRTMSGLHKHWWCGWHLFPIFRNNVVFTDTVNVAGTCFQPSRTMSSLCRHQKSGKAIRHEQCPISIRASIIQVWA